MQVDITEIQKAGAETGSQTEKRQRKLKVGGGPGSTAWQPENAVDDLGEPLTKANEIGVRRQFNPK